MIKCDKIKKITENLVSWCWVCNFWDISPISADNREITFTRKSRNNKYYDIHVYITWYKNNTRFYLTDVVYRFGPNISWLKMDLFHKWSVQKVTIIISEIQTHSYTTNTTVNLYDSYHSKCMTDWMFNIIIMVYKHQLLTKW